MNKHEELLVITMEECGELIQACSKVIRTQGEEQYISNLQAEIGDVMAMIEIIKEYGLVTDEQIHSRIAVKREKLTKWSTLFR